MRKAKIITVCITPEIDREARLLAAECGTTTESKSLFLTTSKYNSFVFNGEFPNSLFMPTLPINPFFSIVYGRPLAG